eukprot:5227041-Pyramimonas_sp.AAC.1
MLVRERTWNGTAKPTLRRTDPTRCDCSNLPPKTCGSLLATTLLTPIASVLRTSLKNWPTTNLSHADPQHQHSLQLRTV